MKKAFVLAATLVAGFLAPSVQASLIHTITHDYGSDYAPTSQTAGSCDTLNADHVTVAVPGISNRNCARFYDVFDFQALDFDSIDSFSLTLEFSDTSSGSVLTELLSTALNLGWHLRPALSGSVDSDQSLRLSITGASVTTQSFTFDSSLNIFSDILTNQTFAIWMAQQSAHSSNPNFKLYGARLDIYGTATPAAQVPAPATLALLGVGLLALRLRRAK